jgi:hypothetical protein
LYYGGTPKIELAPGQKVEICIAPPANNTTLIVQMPDISEDLPRTKLKEMPCLVLISRNVGLLLGDSDVAYGPEDDRVGRLTKHLFYTSAQAVTYTFRNLPPGEYCVFAGPACCMNALKVIVKDGQTSTVRIPPLMTVRQSSVSVWRLSRDIELEGGIHSQGPVRAAQRRD